MAKHVKEDTEDRHNAQSCRVSSGLLKQRKVVKIKFVKRLICSPAGRGQLQGLPWRSS